MCCRPKTWIAAWPNTSALYVTNLSIDPNYSVAGRRQCGHMGVRAGPVHRNQGTVPFVQKSGEKGPRISEPGARCMHGRPISSDTLVRTDMIDGPISGSNLAWFTACNWCCRKKKDISLESCLSFSQDSDIVSEVCIHV
jgi:hypothetical protein